MARNEVLNHALCNLSSKIHENATNKGFVKEGERRPFSDLVALLHSEISEAFEGYRKGNPKDEHCPEFFSIEIELADLFIRLLDTSYEYNVRLVDAVEAKMAYNATRPYKHGKAL